MIIELLSGGIILGIGIGIKWWKNFKSPSSHLAQSPLKIKNYEIRFYSDQHHTLNLLSIPIHLSSPEMDSFEEELINLCKNSQFKTFMNAEGANFVELFELQNQCGILEYRLNQSTPHRYM